MEKKLSKCIITDGRELLKELGIDFQDMEVERPYQINETLKENHKNPCEIVQDLFREEK